MACCGITAIEQRMVVTCNIPGAFLQSDWSKDKPTYIKFEGKMVNTLYDIDPTLKEFIIKTIKKTVYGTLL